MKLVSAKNSFIAWLRFKNYALSTVEKHRFFLDRFLNYLRRENIEEVCQVAEKTIKAYIQERYYTLNRKGRQNTAAARNHEITTVKLFCKYLYQKEHVAENVAANISYIRQPTLVLPKDILTKRELLKLFKQPDITTVLGYRDRTILELLYATGIRAGECCKLSVNDINFKTKTVLIREGKGQKDRVVPVNETGLKFLRNYIENIRQTLVKQQSGDTLILSCNGNIIAPNHFTEILKPHFQSARLKKKLSAHSFRHTCATHLIQSGMPLRHVQELLGHSKLNTTAKYLQLTIKDLQKEYKRFHPRELQS